MAKTMCLLVKRQKNKMLFKEKISQKREVFNLDILSRTDR